VTDLSILLVEDDVRLARLTARYLEANGLRVTVVSDGLLGQAEALRRDYACLVLDVMLPSRSGLDVCRELRAVTKLPIIMVSARADAKERILGLLAGADDYLDKPFSPRELLARILAVVHRSRRGPAA